MLELSASNGSIFGCTPGSEAFPLDLESFLRLVNISRQQFLSWEEDAAWTHFSAS
jgi:hypothetical protein